MFEEFCKKYRTLQSMDWRWLHALLASISWDKLKSRSTSWLVVYGIRSWDIHASVWVSFGNIGWHFLFCAEGLKIVRFQEYVTLCYRIFDCIVPSGIYSYSKVTWFCTSNHYDRLTLLVKNLIEFQIQYNITCRLVPLVLMPWRKRLLISEPNLIKVMKNSEVE